MRGIITKVQAESSYQSDTVNQELYKIWVHNREYSKKLTFPLQGNISRWGLLLLVFLFSLLCQPSLTPDIKQTIIWVLLSCIILTGTSASPSPGLCIRHSRHDEHRLWVVGLRDRLDTSHRRHPGGAREEVTRLESEDQVR